MSDKVASRALLSPRLTDSSAISEGRFPQWFKLLLEIIAFLLRKEERLLVIDTKAIFDTLRHGVGFVPDDLVSEDPTTITHLNCEAGRQTVEETLPLAHDG